MTIELQQAVTALKEHFGPRLEATEDEGRELMAQALQDRLGLDPSQAAEAVAALEHTETIRWIGGAAVYPHAPAPFAETQGAEQGEGAPRHAALPLTGGYWQLGRA